MFFCMVGLPLFGKESSGTPVFKILVRALPLNRERVSLFTTRSDGLERSESNYFCTVISKILVKENIFYFMANLAAR